MTNKDIAARSRTILLVVIGSRLYGTYTEDSDHDKMGVCIEPVESVLGFSEFEQYIEQDRDSSGKMVSEVKIYSLRKFLRLALAGNPDVIPVLFAPYAFHTVSNAVGRQLQDLAPHIVSRRCGARFLGYMESQRQRLLGEIGQKKVNRPELIEKHGYDTKYAMQLIRLGMQGVELLSTGRIILPMVDADKTFLLQVRAGQLPISDVLQRAGDLERELKDIIDCSPLPEAPALDLVEDWMVTRYWDWWRADRMMSDRWDLLGTQQKSET